MITSVRLQNWKSHHDTHITFSPGVNVVIGINGSGKSSVMQAISFALFGTFPQLQRKTLTLGDVVTRKPVPKDHAQVDLTFTLNKTTYTVTRVIGKRGKRFSTTEAEIRADGTLKETNPEAVTRYIEHLLHMDYNLFTKAVYSEQNGIDYFLCLPKGDRKKDIDGMLQLERYERVRAAAVQVANGIEKQIQALSQRLRDQDPDVLREQHKSLAKDIAALQHEQQQKQQEFEQQQKERRELGTRLRAAEQQQEKKTKLTAQLHELTKSEEQLSTRLGHRSLSALKKQREEAHAQISYCDQQQQILEESLQKFRDALAHANAQKKIAEDSLQSLTALESVCPVCEQSITATTKQQLISSREEHKQQHTRAAQEAASHMLEIKKKCELNALKKQEAEQKKHEAIQLLSIAEDVEVNKKRREEVEKELHALPPSEPLHDLRKAYEACSEQCGSLEAETRILASRIADKQVFINTLTSQLNRIEKEIRDIAQKEQAVDQLRRFAKVLTHIQNQLRQTFLESVNTALDTIWPLLYPYSDFSSLQLLVDDGDYVLKVQEKEWVSVDGFVSGGERSAAALALRIAFSLTFLPHLRWLMLDEPTHNLDATAVQQVADILNNSMNSLSDQLFLITHEERLAETGHSIRLHRDKNAQLPTYLQDESS